jgi:hypothetical protein
LSISEERAEAKLLEEPLPFERPAPPVAQAKPQPSVATPFPHEPAPASPAAPAPPRQAVAEVDELVFDIPLISDPPRKPMP